MSITQNNIKDPDLAKVEAALKRAARNARKIAKDTGTPLVIFKNGKIVMIPPEEITDED